ncbi:MAG: thermonuclease family protein [Planctomycetota bacterium]
MSKKRTYAMSRRKLKAIVTICLLIVIFLIWLDHSPASKILPPGLKDSSRYDLPDYEKYNAEIFTVIKVVDGDTLDVDIPDGDRDSTRIRLWGVDTPETKNPKIQPMYFGREACEFTKKLTLGNKVTLYLDLQKTRGYYGRILAYVQLPDKRFLNEALLSEGYAYAELRFPHSFYQKYSQLEAAARGQKKGLWQNVTREKLPDWLKKKKPTFLLQK